jgi:hypothetical protein
MERLAAIEPMPEKAKENLLKINNYPFIVGE